MRKYAYMALSTIIFMTFATIVTASMTIIEPEAAGGAYGSAYFPLENAFDDQPTWDSINSEPTNNDVYAGAGAPAYEDRWGYVDFGANFADITIHEGWTRYRAWSGGQAMGYQEAYWTDTFPGAWPGVLSEKPADAIDDTTVNFNNNNVPNSGDIQWLQSFTYSGGYTPERQYLVMHLSTADVGETTDRASEYAFVGVIPEPSNILLLLGGIGLLTLFRYRR